MSTLDTATGSISQSLYGGSSEIVRISFRLNWTTFDGKAAEKSFVTLMTDHGINKK
jgi:hypothetical protein